MDSGESPGAGEDIRHLAAGEEFILFGIVGDDYHLREYLGHLPMDRLDKPPPLVREKGLVAPHPARLASRQDNAADTRDLSCGKREIKPFRAIVNSKFPPPHIADQGNPRLPADLYR